MKKNDFLAEIVGKRTKRNPNFPDLVEEAAERQNLARKPSVLTTFDGWVADNNMPTTFEYGKGWWDYVELVQRFAHKFDVSDVTVRPYRGGRDRRVEVGLRRGLPVAPRVDRERAATLAVSRADVRAVRPGARPA